MTFDVDNLEKQIFSSVDNKYLGDFNKKETSDKRKTFVYYTDRNKLNEFNKNYFNLDKSKFKVEDKILQFCYLFGIYDNIENNYNQIKDIFVNYSNFDKINLIDMFEIVASYHCSRFISKFEKVNGSIRSRNCELVNLEQEKKLKLKGYDLKSELTKPERRLVLYFRDLSYGGVFQDSFDFLLICYLLNKYVNFGNSKLFTEINVTSRDVYMYPRLVSELFPDIEYKFAKNISEKDSFNMICGLCANTVHFNIATPNEMKFYSIPLLSNITVYDKNKRNHFREHENIQFKEDETYVKLNINYNKNDRYFKTHKGKISKILNTVFGTKNYGSKSDIIEEVLRGIEKLEDVVIEQARIKLTNGAYD
jgi:hypothetical protein